MKNLESSASKMCHVFEKIFLVDQGWGTQGSRMWLPRVSAVPGSNLSQRAASIKNKNIFSGFLCANFLNCTPL